MSGFVLLRILCAVTLFCGCTQVCRHADHGHPTRHISSCSLASWWYCAHAARLLPLADPGAQRDARLYRLRTDCMGTLGNGCHINGYVFFFTVIPLSIIYLLIGMFRDDLNKVLTTVIFAVVSIIFMFSVNIVFNHVLQPHQQNRIKIALGIEEDPKGKGYNVNQSKIAIGSGGLTGKGFLEGTQTKLNYVPEQHTDFIFCTIGEEQGFIGTSAVLILFLTLILRVIAIAERQHTTFGRVYAYCVASMLIFHLTINIGMVIGIVPVIGIPLPFFSYGGSSLWGFTIMLFILLRIDAVRTEYGTW